MPFLLVILGANMLLGQRGATRGLPPVDTTESETPILPDTIKLRYFRLSDITQLYTYRDSTLENFYHQYDPIKRRPFDYLNLGNAGSASRNMIYNATPFIGFHTGLRQYDVYNFELEDFRFFENNVPLADVSFTPVASQENFVVKTDFARSFNDGTSISLNYHRIRQVGFYTNQTTKITNFGVSVRFQSENKKYTGFLSMISNVNEEGNNGGVADTTLFDQPFYQNRANIPVIISDAQTRHQQKLYSLINYYQLNNPATSRVKLLMRYDFTVDNQYYKFTDSRVSTTSDRDYYGNFIIEDRGIRFYNDVNRIGNAFYLYASDGNRLNFRAGIVYDRNKISAQSTENRFDNLYLDFKGKLPLFKSLLVDTEGKLGLADAAGDFYAKGSLALQLSDWVEMKGGISLFRHNPELMYRNLILNDINVWNYEFAKPVGSNLFGVFSIPKLGLEAQVNQNVITNLLYYNENALPAQSTDVFSATSLTIAHQFRFRKLGMENYLLFQAFSDNTFNLPTYHSKHNIHLTGYLFKRALLARIGAEARFTPTYEGARYMPVIGTFYQGTDDLDFYPMVDVYLTGKIKKARLFLRFENVVNIFRDDILYQTYNHPQFDFKFRFGIRWVMLN